MNLGEWVSELKRFDSRRKMRSIAPLWAFFATQKRAFSAAEPPSTIRSAVPYERMQPAPAPVAPKADACYRRLWDGAAFTSPTSPEMLLLSLQVPLLLDLPTAQKDYHNFADGLAFYSIEMAEYIAKNPHLIEVKRDCEVIYCPLPKHQKTVLLRGQTKGPSD